MKRRSVAVHPWTADDSLEAPDCWRECWASVGIAPADTPEPAGVVNLAGCSGAAYAITLDGVTSGVALLGDEAGVMLVALVKAVRGFGYGSEAVRLLEDVESPDRPRRALASPAIGLSLYFWLRLGYAPSSRQPYGSRALLLEKPRGERRHAGR